MGITKLHGCGLLCSVDSVTHSMMAGAIGTHSQHLTILSQPQCPTSQFSKQTVQTREEFPVLVCESQSENPLTEKPSML